MSKNLKPSEETLFEDTSQDYILEEGFQSLHDLINEIYEKETSYLDTLKEKYGDDFVHLSTQIKVDKYWTDDPYEDEDVYYNFRVTYLLKGKSLDAKIASWEIWKDQKKRIKEAKERMFKEAEDEAARHEALVELNEYKTYLKLKEKYIHGL